MNLRWLVLDYVDPALPLTRKERRGIWWQAYGAAWRKGEARKALTSSRFAWAPFFAQAMAPSACSFGPLLIWMLVFHSAMAGAVPAVLGGFALCWVGTTWLGRFTWKRHINTALREMGYDICPQCGYWLRGLDDAVMRCPECGKPREPLPPSRPGDAANNPPP